MTESIPSDEIKNEVAEVFNSVEHAFAYTKIMSVIEIIGPVKTTLGDFNVMDMLKRRTFIEKYGYSVPSLDVLNSLAKIIRENGCRCLSVGSGNKATVETLLGCYKGVDIIATDNFSSYGSELKCTDDIMTYNESIIGGVLQIDAVDAIELFCDCINPYRVLFMAWPPYAASMAYNALVAFEKATSKLTEPVILIYWGEYEGGCTADDDFFGRLATHWKSVDFGASVKRWAMINDEIQVFVKL
jgi:hypothetical protein